MKPESQDIESVEREYGQLPIMATLEQRAYRYWLYQAAALIRLFEETESQEARQ